MNCEVKSCRNGWIFLTPPDPLVSGRRLRLRYITALCETFDLPGTPIRMMLRKGKNPYDPR